MQCGEHAVNKTRQCKVLRLVATPNLRTKTAIISLNWLASQPHYIFLRNSICLSHERTWGILFKSRYTNVRIIIIIIIIILLDITGPACTDAADMGDDHSCEEWWNLTFLQMYCMNVLLPSFFCRISLT